MASAEDVNVHDAIQIAQDMQKRFTESLPDGFHKPIKKTVKTMQVLKRGMKVKDKTIYELGAIFVRNKSVLLHRLGSITTSGPPPDLMLVDASQLLYHIVWPSSGTLGDVANGMKYRLGKHSGVGTYVIFDRYDGASAQDHERQRRAGDGSTEYQLTLNSVLPGRDAIMKNKQNKKQLAQLLCTHNLGNRIELGSRADSIVKHDEADISLISYMLHAVSRGAQTVRLFFWCIGVIKLM